VPSATLERLERIVPEMDKLNLYLPKPTSVKKVAEETE